MHHALEIQEILFNIFGHCYPPDSRSEDSNLVALARTCRTFKEPALDVLWESLDSLFPLAQCISEASYISTADDNKDSRTYSFSRPFTQSEWDTLRGYTRRIKSVSIWDSLYELDWESVRILSKPPTTEPIFPNLCHLYFKYTDRAIPVLLLPFPSLISLNIRLLDVELFDHSLKAFAMISPNVKSLSIYADRYASLDITKVELDTVCQWRNIQEILCCEISLDVNTLLHLSRMSTLTWLGFTLCSTLPDQIPSSNSPVFFPNLHYLSLRSKSLDPVSRFLYRTQLPVLTNFATSFTSRPSKQDFSFFLASLHTSGINHTIQELHVRQEFVLDRTYVLDSEDPRPMFGLEDLHPCMAFTNLRRIDFDIECKMDLMDSELLLLTSAWPCLEHFAISEMWGRRSLGRITPN